MRSFDGLQRRSNPADKRVRVGNGCARPTELDFPMHNSGDLDDRPTRTGDDDTEHVLARSATDAVTAPAYTITARLLHWITALVILFMIPIGVIIANEWGGSLQNSLYDLHRSMGAVLIPIVILRLIYRWANPPLPLPNDIAAIQRLAAHATHWGLYALLIVQPFVGWIATSAYPASIKVFGWVELPPIWSENRALSGQLFFIHRWIGIAIAGLVVAHVGAALHHHFVRKDRVLMRMITG
jgi:cytochrome b561